MSLNHPTGVPTREDFTERPEDSVTRCWDEMERGNIDAIPLLARHYKRERDPLALVDLYEHVGRHVAVSDVDEQIGYLRAALHIQRDEYEDSPDARRLEDAIIALERDRARTNGPNPDDLVRQRRHTSAMLNEELQRLRWIGTDYDGLIEAVQQADTDEDWHTVIDLCSEGAKTPGFSVAQRLRLVKWALHGANFIRPATAAIYLIRLNRATRAMAPLSSEARSVYRFVVADQSRLNENANQRQTAIDVLVGAARFDPVQYLAAAQCCVRAAVAEPLNGPKFVEQAQSAFGSAVQVALDQLEQAGEVEGGLRYAAIELVDFCILSGDGYGAYLALESQRQIYWNPTDHRLSRYIENIESYRKEAIDHVIGDIASSRRLVDSSDLASTAVGRLRSIGAGNDGLIRAIKYLESIIEYRHNGPVGALAEVVNGEGDIWTQFTLGPDLNGSASWALELRDVQHRIVRELMTDSPERDLYALLVSAWDQRLGPNELDSLAQPRPEWSDVELLQASLAFISRNRLDLARRISPLEEGSSDLLSARLTAMRAQGRFCDVAELADKTFRETGSADSDLALLAAIGWAHVGNEKAMRERIADMERLGSNSAEMLDILNDVQLGLRVLMTKKTLASVERVVEHAEDDPLLQLEARARAWVALVPDYAVREMISELDEGTQAFVTDVYDTAMTRAQRLVELRTAERLELMVTENTSGFDLDVAHLRLGVALISAGESDAGFIELDKVEDTDLAIRAAMRKMYSLEARGRVYEAALVSETCAGLFPQHPMATSIVDVKKLDVRVPEIVSLAAVYDETASFWQLLEGVTVAGERAALEDPTRMLACIDKARAIGLTPLVTVNEVDSLIQAGRLAEAMGRVVEDIERGNTGGAATLLYAYAERRSPEEVRELASALDKRDLLDADSLRQIRHGLERVPGMEVTSVTVLRAAMQESSSLDLAERIELTLDLVDAHIDASQPEFATEELMSAARMAPLLGQETLADGRLAIDAIGSKLQQTESHLEPDGCLAVIASVATLCESPELARDAAERAFERGDYLMSSALLAVAMELTESQRPDEATSDRAVAPEIDWDSFLGDSGGRPSRSDPPIADFPPRRDAPDVDGPETRGGFEL